MSAKVQFNIRLPSHLVNKARGDARRYGKTLDGVGETIIADFYHAFNRKEREAIFRGATVKRQGRKVKTAPSN